MKELGVGIVFFGGYEHILASHASLIDVIEIEPQTFWYNKNDRCDAFNTDMRSLDFLKDKGLPLLFHGVGNPVGGTCKPEQAHFNTLRRQADELTPSWVSEHLSFNMFRDRGTYVNSGFLLPPLQSYQSVTLAAANIKHYRAQMGLPFAFETAVSYLRPRRGELPDGDFVAMVAEKADCHILLDLHNIMTNHRNGRQSVDDYINSLPLERVVELHVAGGTTMRNYYLDAHSDISDNELWDIVERVIVRLPNLGALIFEISPDYITKISKDAMHRQLVAMHRMWSKRGTRKMVSPFKQVEKENAQEEISVAEWEDALGHLAVGQNAGASLAAELATDPGVAIIQDIVFNFRGSMLVTNLLLTTRLFRLSVGEAAFRKHMNHFFENYFPDLFPIVMAEQFASYLADSNTRVPFLLKVLEYELAVMHTAIDRQTREVNFDFDAPRLFAALESGHLPVGNVDDISIKLVITDDVIAPAQMNAFSNVYHE